MAATDPQPVSEAALSVGAAVNGVYAIGSLMLGLLAVKLFSDRLRDRRAVYGHPRPSPQDVELVRHDTEQETVRFGKQMLAIVLLWTPMLARPHLREWPDRPLFELLRFGVFTFMAGLLFNSYRSLSFRQRFRRKWGRPPAPTPGPDGA